MNDTMQSVHEPSRKTPVRDQVDVLVVGGGLGGVAAAVASARAGASTLLIERNGFLGGVATAGMCCSIFNCYFTADGRLGVKGVAVEVADAVAEAAGFGAKWRRHKGHIIYDVEQAKVVLDRLVDQAGARVLTDTVVSGVVQEGARLRGVIVESKGGREAILAKVVIDATGDADMAARAGAALHVHPNHRHSFCSRLGRVDVDRFVQHFIDHPGQYPEHMDVDWTFEEALAQYRDTGTLLFPHGGTLQMDLFREGVETGELPESVGAHDRVAAMQMHALRDRGVVHLITGFVTLGGLDAAKISEATRDGRRMAQAVAGFFQRRVPGFEEAFIVATADDLGIRFSRSLDGEFTLTRAMKEGGARFDDAIGRGVAELHLKKNPAKGAWSVQTLTNSLYDVPYRCLLPRNVEGLLMGAGRSVSAEGPILRVMAMTMVVGQGAGAAAAVAAGSGVAPREVSLAAVQNALRRQGALGDRP